MRDRAKKAILASGTLRLVAGLRGASAVILMYHSVLPDPASLADSLGQIIHSEKVFGQQMEMLARDFHPVSLDQVAEFVRGSATLPRRSVAVTFDDGYADNYEVAMPVLNRAGVPATFYATVDCIENRRPPWPTRLRFAIRNTRLPAWTTLQGQSWSLKDLADREKAFDEACNVCCQLNAAAQEEFMRRVEQKLEVRLPDSSASLMMTHQQLRALIKNGHGVGSHTMTHPNMAYLQADAAQFELSESKRRLESLLDTSIRHFSYPCPALSPHWSARTLEQSRIAGYDTGVTTNSGTNKRDNNLLCLNRIRPTKTLGGLRWNLESAFAGRDV